MHNPLSKFKIWPSTLVTLLLVPIFCALGMWQLQRATAKRHYLEVLQTAPLKQAADLQGANLNADNIFRLQLRGHFDPQQQFLLDNKHWHGFIGYQVITPFYAEGLAQPILINRGWVPRAPDRNLLPELPTPSGTVTIHGLAKVPELNPFIKGSGLIANSPWPKIAQQLIIAAFSQELRQDLNSRVILLDENDPGSFRIEWQITPMPPEKHVGYAIQWFAMATTLLIMWSVLKYKRVRKL